MMQHPAVSSLRLSPTSLAQYIRLENCERYLRFRLVDEDVKRLEKQWNITIQPLTPLLKESGADFEQNIAAKLAARGETIIDLEKQEVSQTLQWFRDIKAPTILYQPALEAPLGRYLCSGRADIIHLSRDRQNGLKVWIADIKATRLEKTEHRLQVATYARMIETLASQHNLPLAEIRGSVLTQQEDGSYPTLTQDTPTFELDTYLTILDRLAVDDNSVVNQVASRPFKENFYNLSYKCDGCLYNALCMYDSAETLDLSLTPHITAVEKRVLQEAGIQTLPELAALMDLPPNGIFELRPAPSHERELTELNNRWPVAPNLPFLVQRAKAAVHQFDKSVDSRPFLLNSGFGTLPSESDYPNLIRIFFDAQRDYLQDRVYLISALITCRGSEKGIVNCTDKPPTDALEGALLVDWVRRVILAAREIAGSDQAFIHLYCYNRYDQKVLLEALKRHLDEVAAIPAFFDLLTQSPALTQPIISFLADEVQEHMNMGRVCAPLHDVARWRGFDWADEKHVFWQLFRARMFDNRRDVIRSTQGELLCLDYESVKNHPGKITIEAASRFNSQIPLEYAYAAWGCLPESKENSRLLEPFRKVDLPALRAFAEKRVHALAHIENSFKVKARFLNKQPFSLPDLLQSNAAIDPAQSLVEFLYMEHHTALQNKLLNYSYPIERRVQSGLALLLKFTGKTDSNSLRFAPEFSSLGLDPVLTMNASKLKEGDWVVLNANQAGLTGNRIKHGRLAIIENVSQSNLALQLLDITFRDGNFRYFHDNRLQPVPGEFYIIDQMADDLNADKILAALANVESNTFFHWLISKPSNRQSDPRTVDFCNKFAEYVGTYLKNKSRPLTSRQREVLAEHHDKPLLLVQGPPGTGKSYTLAWAILARVAAAAVFGRPLRVLISCKTHNAINVELQALAQAQQQISTFATQQMGGNVLRGLEIYKLVNDPGDPVARGTKAISPYSQKESLEPLIQKPYIIFGATSGGVYNLMRYRALGGRNIDWLTKTFDLVVIDEASQMSVPEGVLAGAFLKAGGSMIVVGDHRQMPPIIAHPWKEEQKRSVADSRPYISLFETLVERSFPQVKLDESFRLHEQIAEFLRENIYSKDGIHFHSRRRELINPLPKLDRYVDVVLAPQYPIVVIEHTEQGSQQFNPIELELSRPLIEACVHHLSLDGRNGIGVVVPHRAQKALLRAQFPDLADVNSIDTVERFQGDERDVIIVSATASDPDYVRSEADFLLNLNRLNVAISRPRKKLIVLASRSVIDLLTSDLETFEQSVIWKRLYHHYTPNLLLQGKINGYEVLVRGRLASQT